MYKNPLNNGDISDYNSLKKQMNNGVRVKKYQSIKLKTEPDELQKYYEYMTYQQPILDESNYIAERMRTEDIKKKTDDYDFTEKLKIERENKMKEQSTNEKSMDSEIRQELFDEASTVKNDDITPIITTDIELETEPQPQEKIISNTPEIEAVKQDLFGEGDYNVFDDLLSIAETAPIIKEKFELSKENKKKEKTPEQLAEIEQNKAEAKAKKEQAKQAKKAEKEAKKAEKEAEKEAKKAETKAKREAKKAETKAKKAEEKKAEIKAEIKAEAKVEEKAKKTEKKYSNIPKNKIKGSKGSKGVVKVKLGSKIK